MPLITRKLIIKDKVDSGVIPYKDINQVPGINEIIKKNNNGSFNKLLDFIKKNLDNPSLVAQAVDMKREGEVLFVVNIGQHPSGWMLPRDKKYVEAGCGFKTQQFLGQGKDGWTNLSTRYLDSSKNVDQKYVVKYFSDYAKTYLEHTKAIMHFIGENNKVKGKKEEYPKMLDFWIVKSRYMYRTLTNNEIYNESSIDPQMFVKYVAEICRSNHWMIKNWGICFWDLGMTNGKNYMVNNESEVKWVDYGGAGIVRLLNSQTKLGKYPYKLQPVHRKNNIVIADSQFLMLQLILHLEYWYCKFNKQLTKSGYYSSIIQINKSLLQEINKLIIPEILTWDLTKDLYREFKDQNWLDALVWKQVAKYLDSY